MHARISKKVKKKKADLLDRYKNKHNIVIAKILSNIFGHI